jgi:hypothetical protein
MRSSEFCYDGTANLSLITVFARVQGERQESISYTLSCLHRQQYLESFLPSGIPLSKSCEKWATIQVSKAKECFSFSLDDREPLFELVIRGGL